MKKLLSILLIICLFNTILPSIILAEETSTSEQQTVLDIKFTEGKDVGDVVTEYREFEPVAADADGKLYVQGKSTSTGSTGRLLSVVETKPLTEKVTIQFDYMSYKDTNRGYGIQITSNSGVVLQLQNINSQLRGPGDVPCIPTGAYVAPTPAVWYDCSIELDTTTGTDNVNIFVNNVKTQTFSIGEIKDAIITKVNFGYMMKMSYLKLSATKIEQSDDATILEPQAKELEAQIKALPEITFDEQRTKAVLELALEYVYGNINANNKKRAEDLINDISASINKNLGRMDNTQQFFLPLVSEDKNIDLSLYYKGIEGRLETSDTVFNIPVAGKIPYTGLGGAYGTRDVGLDIFGYLVATSHPDSKYLNNIELFKRSLKRAIVYMESSYVDPKNVDLNEFFTQDRNYFSIYAFKKVFPDAFLPSQWEVCKTVTKNMQDQNLKDQQAGKLEDWINENLSIASALIHGGMMVDNQEYITAGEEVLTLHQSEQFADGGLQYYRGQNESLGYHNINVEVANRIYLSTRDEIALNLMVKSKNYIPLTIEPPLVGNFAAAPAWKWTWNTSNGYSKQATYFSKSNLLKNYHDTFLKYKEAEVAEKLPAIVPFNAMIDISDIEATPLPNNYTVYDSNLQGTRTRYNNFSTFTTARDCDEPVGLLTHISTMAVDDFDVTKPNPLNASMGAVYAGPRMKTGDTLWNTTAQHSDNSNDTLLMGKEIAGLTTSHSLSGQNSGPTKWPSDWKGDQQWLTLPDRVIGMVTVYPGQEQAFDVTGRVKMLYGGTGPKYPKNIEVIDENNYKYGDLGIKIYEHNYGKISIAENMEILRNSPDRNLATDIVFIDTESLASESQTLRTYDKPYYFIVECFYKDAEGQASVTKIDTENLRGIKVELNGKTYSIVENISNSTVTVNPKDFVPNAEAVILKFKEGEANPTQNATPTSIGPYGAMLISDNVIDKTAPFKSFDEMIAQFEENEYTIIELRNPQSKMVLLGTTADNLNLPNSVTVKLSNNQLYEMPVTWTQDSNTVQYDGNTLGKYIFKGTLSSVNGILNSNQYTTSIEINVVNNIAEEIFKNSINNAKEVLDTTNATSEIIVKSIKDLSAAIIKFTK